MIVGQIVFLYWRKWAWKLGVTDGGLAMTTMNPWNPHVTDDWDCRLFLLLLLLLLCGTTIGGGDQVGDFILLGDRRSIRGRRREHQIGQVQRFSASVGGIVGTCFLSTTVTTSAGSDSPSYREDRQIARQRGQVTVQQWPYRMLGQIDNVAPQVTLGDQLHHHHKFNALVRKLT